MAKSESLCIQILNSNQVDALSSQARRDMLEDETWMHDLLVQWTLDAPIPIPEEVIGKIKELRDEMFAFLTGTSDELDLINQLLNSVSVHLRVETRQGKYGITQTYDVDGWDLVLWRIAKSFADILCDHDLSRIKVCDNADCDWVFYDTSKNKSRRWCSDKTCGNVMKVRRFRERQHQPTNEKGD